MSAAKREQQFARQEQLLKTLERLEQRDTQHKAANELCKMDLDANALSTLLHVLSIQTAAKTSQFARVECLRVMALLTTPLCPLRQTVMAQPTFNKLLGLLVARLGDTDSRVRETAGAACSAVAEQMRDFFGEDPTTAGDVATNPLLRGIFTAVTEQNRDVQAAASHAFALVASHIQPVVPALLRQLVKALDSPAFPAKAELWPSFAHRSEGACGGGAPASVQGLVKSSLGVMRTHIALIVGIVGPGQAKTGGLLGALAAPEWQARKAAAETLEALAMALGPDWDGTGSAGADSSNAQLLDAVVQGLARAKYDKVKPAREAMQAAVLTCAAVQRMIRGGSGGDSCQFATEGPVHGSKGVKGSSCQGGTGPLPAEATPPLSFMPAEQFHVAANGQHFNIAALKSPIVSSPTHFPGSAALVTLASLHAEQQRMTEALNLLTSSTSAALAQLQQHIASLELQISAISSTAETPPAGLVSSLLPSQVAQLPEPAQCCSPAGVGLPQALTLRGPWPAISKPGSPSKGLGLADLRASHDQLLDELQSLRGSLVDSLGASAAAATAGPPPPPGTVSDRLVQEAGAESPPASMDALFSKLVCSEGGIMNELKLLRAMNRHGPVWEQLSISTAQGVLQALQHLLEGKSALAKLMPWLWPLADEVLGACFSIEHKLGLLQALKLCQDGEDQELNEKVSMLLSTLKAVWGVTGMT